MNDLHAFEKSGAKTWGKSHSHPSTGSLASKRSAVKRSVFPIANTNVGRPRVALLNLGNHLSANTVLTPLREDIDSLMPAEDIVQG